MQTNVLPKMNMDTATTGCCPKFNPEGWDGRHLHFEDKLFVRATTRCIFHRPIDMGSVFTRVQQHIEDAGAQAPDSYFVLSRDLTSTTGEHFFAVTKDVPDEEMVRLSGNFITRVFEGSYSHARDWMHEMETAAEADGHTAQRVYMFYTTCPKCARTYGRNYVVGVARID